jgi:hypothetical protein
MRMPAMASEHVTLFEAALVVCGYIWICVAWMAQELSGINLYI